MRLPSLDGVRAISIAMVVAVHAGDERGLLTYGRFGVNIFFVLSGFLITWLLCSEEKKSGHSINLSSFYARRAFRILPPALVYIAAVSILFGPQWSDIAHCLFFYRNVTGGPIYTVHFWSLSIEEQFYLLWPSIFLLLGSNFRRLVFTIATLALFPIWIQATFKAGGVLLTPMPRFDLRCDALLAGCCLALLRNDARFNPWMRGRFLQSGWVMCAALASLLYTVGGQGPAALTGVLSSIAVAVVLNILVEKKDGVLNSTPFVWVGKMSYSMYIWQQLFCCKPQVGWFGRFPQNVIFTVVMACLSYYLIEQPVLSFRNRRSKGRPLEGVLPEGGLAQETL